MARGKISRFFFLPLPAQISLFFRSLGVFFVDLWPWLKAMAHVSVSLGSFFASSGGTSPFPSPPTQTPPLPPLPPPKKRRKAKNNWIFLTKRPSGREERRNKPKPKNLLLVWERGGEGSYHFPKPKLVSGNLVGCALGRSTWHLQLSPP